MGLHQAVEAKEGVKIERENQTLATITFQNYFRMYKKLAGMTGTAETEAAEFDKIYKLEVVVIPTNRDLIRDGERRTSSIARRRKSTLPRRTRSQRSTRDGTAGAGGHDFDREVGAALRAAEEEGHQARGAERQVPRARSRDRGPGRALRAVTIATNMAGRGTDILLGGNPEFMAKQECVKQGLGAAGESRGGRSGGEARRSDDDLLVLRRETSIACPPTQWQEMLSSYKAETDEEHAQVIAAGGLFILGTERHESRRIDNQLRGRAGRQGDPGASRFYLSLEDDLMRIFAKEWVSTLLQRLGMEEGVPIESTHDHAAHRSGAEGGGRPELSRLANICSSTTT